MSSKATKHSQDELEAIEAMRLLSQGIQPGGTRSIDGTEPSATQFSHMRTQDGAPPTDPESKFPPDLQEYGATLRELQGRLLGKMQEVEQRAEQAGQESGSGGPAFPRALSDQRTVTGATADGSGDNRSVGHPSQTLPASTSTGEQQTMDQSNSPVNYLSIASTNCAPPGLDDAGRWIPDALTEDEVDVIVKHNELWRTRGWELRMQKHLFEEGEKRPAGNRSDLWAFRILHSFTGGLEPVSKKPIKGSRARKKAASASSPEAPKQHQPRFDVEIYAGRAYWTDERGDPLEEAAFATCKTKKMSVSSFSSANDKGFTSCFFPENSRRALDFQKWVESNGLRPLQTALQAHLEAVCRDDFARYVQSQADWIAACRAETAASIRGDAATEEHIQEEDS